MSFINARGKLRPYTCIYTRVRERERERSDCGRGGGEMTRRVERKSEVKGTRGTGGRKRRRRSIHRSASSPGVGRLSLRVPSLAPPIIIIFYHNICFSHILFYVNGRSLLLPAPSASLSLTLPLPLPHPPLADPPPFQPDGRRFVCMASGNF